MYKQRTMTGPLHGMLKILYTLRLNRVEFIDHGLSIFEMCEMQGVEGS
jgi:hypothetical protein